MTAPPRTRDDWALLHSEQARLHREARVAGWAATMEPLQVESARSRNMAHVGVIASVTALLGYLTWRIGFTMPADGWNRVAAWLLIAFEAFPLFGLITRMVTLWNIDCRAPEPVTEVRPGFRVAVLIPTYNEPIEVIAPTIAASCELQPAHETWVLDDGDRPWVAEMCAALGARYVRRDEHAHAKAGNMNHALDLMAAESAAGANPIDIVAVLDCDHVPMPAFLSATLGWFEDPKIALVQGPQTYYNSGAFDDDGDTGEQGVFFHVLMPARNRDGAGPFWCGSTSLIRVSALREVGGISTATIVEDMHTTLELIRRGWKTAYHHQILALGLAPDTPEQYLLQRRRWGMGSMQVLIKERLWAAKRWLSLRNFYEYLTGTLWWLEGVGTVLAFLIPALVLVSGARVSTADPLLFTSIFVAMFSVRLWGAKRLFRMHIHWPTAFALRILRVPVGLSCIWWLLSRRALQFQVTPKAGADERLRGRAPRVLWTLGVLLGGVFVYAAAGLTGWAPWHTTPTATVASGAWLALAGVVLLLGLRRIKSEAYATSRRNAYRFPIRARIHLGDVPCELLDLSIGGAAVRFPAGALTDVDRTELRLPGAVPISIRIVRTRAGTSGSEIASLKVARHDWLAYRELALWLFHTPPGAIDGLPVKVPAVALRHYANQRPNPALRRQYGHR